jgi:hypothetical protein
MSDERTIDDRLAAAQGNIANPKMDAEADMGRFKTKYATLANVLDVVRPACNKEGLFLTQRLIEKKDGKSAVITKVSCGGKSETLDMFPVDVVPNMQSFGSTITYARRYSLLNAFGIAGADDDDGTGGEQQEAPESEASPEKKSLLGDLMREASGLGVKPSTIKAWAIRVTRSSIEKLSESEIDIVIDHVKDVISTKKQAAGEVVQTEEVPFV